MIWLLASAALLVGNGQDAQPLITERPGTAADVRELGVTLPPERGDWRIVSTDTGAAVALDVANIERRETIRTIWIARTAVNGRPADAYSVASLEMDCRAGKARPIWFARHNASGAMIAGFAPQRPAEPYESMSGGAQIAAAVCGGQELAGPGLQTHQAFATANPR